eukprot:CAMPEP_0183361900 /NCGR_PEP_ID=MMETSP0164_2-20130417/64889_1 /TAXON_ID=221442 /ORGANISM="Coccolithus pelagicus ssp braarudi, Strain PLY182g" /LENGTH=151 /DNA_ID=CAMNT_0025536615 /DNA_START=22 /DNA_END=478 /DNA_ORIENTATION=+
MADEKKKKVTVLDMSKYLDRSVRVKFVGGREVEGILKGYDALLNLVLDDTKEFLKALDDPGKLLDETRPLGLTVCRGTSVMLVCPTNGFEEIENPFLQEEERRELDSGIVSGIVLTPLCVPIFAVPLPGTLQWERPFAVLRTGGVYVVLGS